MRIAYLAAGAAGMYCGSCLHDNTLAAALLKLGEDVILAPIYTPIRTDEVDVSEPRVFFGGINAYLQQKFPLFRRTPRWLDGWLDHPALLRMATKNAASVDASQLGDMTVSMLQGELGNQRKELEKLVDWLVGEAKPDVVHLSNSMMLGLARLIRERGGPPIVCSLSGEDIFLEKLTPPYYEQARQLLRERAADVAAFVALNGYYADFMADYMSVPRERIAVIPHGVDLQGHGDPKPRPADAPRRIGFFARICHDKGLHLLIEAAEQLIPLPRREGLGEGFPTLPSRSASTHSPSAKIPPLTPPFEGGGDALLPAFEIHAAGYLGGGDRQYLADIERRVARGPLAGRFTYHGELDRTKKIEFLQSLDVMALPTVYRESKGLPVLEAWANATPVILPAHGAFPEMIADVDGGLLHEPLNARHLAEQLASALLRPAELASLGRRGQEAVRDRYHAQAMAEQTLALYRTLKSPTPHASLANP
jgi:glycosyltransferase involved in cell wall biosynthesis